MLAGLAPNSKGPQMKLKARKYIRYAGKPVHAGDVFEVRDADVRVLIAIGTAEKYVEPPKRAVPAVFKPIPDAPADEVTVAAQIDEFSAARFAHEAGAEDKPKRAYKRRDMTAE